MEGDEVQHVIPALIFVGLILMGFIMKIFEIRQLNNRLDFTVDYFNNLGRILDSKKKGKVDMELYVWLTEKVIKMQHELGENGVVFYQDRLVGVRHSSYQLLPNFLPQIIGNEDFGNSILLERFDQYARTCFDMFLRHKGDLDERIANEKKSVFNPFTCFAKSLGWILFFPVNILYWSKLVSFNALYKIRKSFILKFLNFLAIIIGLISATVTITLGLDETIEIVNAFLQGIN